jgi:hypothetical protein
MGAKRNEDARITTTREVIPGIVADAETLGVSRMHLWAVLRGRRFSPGLLERYRKLKLSNRMA